jgi:methylenetetrahydrofolate--tRNA-(uracil-5-)-methyltransferase
MSVAVTVIGGGLAGVEAAWRLAEAGIGVRLVDQKPATRSPAHTSSELAELVCSNSLRSRNLLNAVGLLKEEMRRLGSLVMRAALEARVPGGDALAVNRVAFSRLVSEALRGHPNITCQSELVERLPLPEAGPAVIATGPLTAMPLAEDIAGITGRERLYFYDAIAPIVAGDSIDRTVAFAASRYDKGGGADYLNCPLDAAEYEAFVAAVLTAEEMPLHACEEPKYFQGCLPLETVAKSGRDALRFGAMKPVGLRDPRTGKRPYAVVQLRQEDQAGQAYNLVGFQTKLKHPDQRRILRMIPGLAQAEFLRLGAIHRNTYLDSPALLDERMRLRVRPHLHFAGQMTGVEGYVESAAHGLVTAILLAAELRGRQIPLPPPECALGGLYRHVLGYGHIPGRPHEPANVNWSMMPPLPVGTRKSEMKIARVQRAVGAFEAWAASASLPLAAAQPLEPLALGRGAPFERLLSRVGEAVDRKN